MYSYRYEKRIKYYGNTNTPSTSIGSDRPGNKFHSKKKTCLGAII